MRVDAPAAEDLRGATTPLHATTSLPPTELLATAVAPVAPEERLSDERTYTRWAHPLTTSLIRAAPLPGASAVGRLHSSTEEGEPEVYLLLDQLTNAGVTWVRLRVPGRPNGRIGWVRRSDLGAFHLTHWAFSVDLSRLRATLFLDGRETWNAPIGVGSSPATPTPVGHFWIREPLHVPGNTLYGPFAFGTSDYSTLSEWPHGGVVGIHGTNQPQLIPGRPSHGCVRMSNADITYLAHHLPIGAPVNIVA